MKKFNMLFSLSGGVGGRGIGMRSHKYSKLNLKRVIYQQSFDTMEEKAFYGRFGFATEQQRRNFWIKVKNRKNFNNNLRIIEK